MTTLKLSDKMVEFPIRTVGNNGNQIVDVLHANDLLKDGMTVEQIAEAIRPYMIKEHHLDRDDIWEDVFYRAEELGYKLAY
jgi:hypothetical protein